MLWLRRWMLALQKKVVWKVVPHAPSQYVVAVYGGGTRKIIASDLIRWRVWHNHRVSSNELDETDMEVIRLLPLTPIEYGPYLKEINK